MREERARAQQQHNAHETKEPRIQQGTEHDPIRIGAASIRDRNSPPAVPSCSIRWAPAAAVASVRVSRPIVSTYSLFSSSISTTFWAPVRGYEMLSCSTSQRRQQQQRREGSERQRSEQRRRASTATRSSRVAASRRRRRRAAMEQQQQQRAPAPTEETEQSRASRQAASRGTERASVSTSGRGGDSTVRSGCACCFCCSCCPSSYLHVCVNVVGVALLL